MPLVVDYGEVNKNTQNHSGSIPNMENILERIAKCPTCCIPFLALLFRPIVVLPSLSRNVQ